jgi:L-threonylcarbamoyladenylate synthase
MLERHYAPQAELHLFTGSDKAILQAMHQALVQAQQNGRVVALLIATEDVTQFAAYPVVQQVVGSLHDLDGVAHHLFYALRELDTAETQLILARDFPAEGLGLAVRDRLRRAAERVIDADME